MHTKQRLDYWEPTVWRQDTPCTLARATTLQALTAQQHRNVCVTYILQALYDLLHVYALTVIRNEGKLDGYSSQYNIVLIAGSHLQVTCWSHEYSLHNNGIKLPNLISKKRVRCNKFVAAMLQILQFLIDCRGREAYVKEVVHKTAVMLLSGKYPAW